MNLPPPIPRTPPPVKSTNLGGFKDKDLTLLAIGGGAAAMLLLLAVVLLFTFGGFFTDETEPQFANVGDSNPADVVQDEQATITPPTFDGSQEPPAMEFPESPPSADTSVPDDAQPTNSAEPFLPTEDELPPIPDEAPADPSIPHDKSKPNDSDGKIDIKSNSIILTQSIGDFMESKIELFGKVNFRSHGLEDMSKFSSPTIYTENPQGRKRPERFMRRPPDHLEWWKHSRANELDLPEKIYRYGSKWHLFDRRKDERQVLVAWHEEKPEIYVRVDSDNPNRPIGPQELVELRSDYQDSEARLLAIRKSIANVPIIKFASNYKVNTKLDRLDYQINQNLRLTTADSDDSLRSNFMDLRDIVVALPETIENICLELAQRNRANQIKIARVAADNPPQTYRNPITGEYSGETQAQWQSRINTMTSLIRKEISDIDSVTVNVDAQIAMMLSNLQEAIELMADLSQTIDAIKSKPELYFTLPESLIIRTANGDQIEQKLRFDVVIHN